MKPFEEEVSFTDYAKRRDERKRNEKRPRG